jgi:hypothetical protein
MKKPAVTLPDIEDDVVFAARLQPLASKILPREPEARLTDIPDIRNSEVPEAGNSGFGRQAVAARRDEIEAKRGPKKRYEYVLPVRVGDALAEDARRNGLSATAHLLQVLRNAGYPVIPEDLIDLRLERARKVAV